MGATFQCALDGAALASCTSPRAYSGLAAASHAFQVRQTDTAGNTGVAASYTWTIDTTAPGAPSITLGPTGLINQTSASFSFTGEAGASFQCALDGAAFAACTSPKAYNGLADGAHTFQVRQIDTAGNTGPAASRSWTVDATAPAAPTITVGPTGQTNQASASFTFTGEAAATYECSLDGAAFTSCASPKPYSGLAEGAHTFQVRQTDTAGNTGAAASRSWIVDTTAPAAPTITVGPTGLTNQTSASFSFTGEAGGTFQCSLDGAAFAACTSPKAYSGLADGAHAFQVRQMDTAGNTGPAASRSWTVDATAPVAPAITVGPAALTNLTSASFSFTGEAAASFECSLDGAAFTSCASAKTYSGLADGAHTFQVRQVDTAGNTGPASNRAWTVDSTPPGTVIDAAPSDPSTADVGFDFSSPDGGVAFECELDGGGFSVCSSPASYAGLASGPHTFDVRAIDSAGNVDPTPASFTWSVS